MEGYIEVFHYHVVHLSFSLLMYIFKNFGKMGVCGNIPVPQTVKRVCQNIHNHETGLLRWIRFSNAPFRHLGGRGELETKKRVFHKRSLLS